MSVIRVKCTDQALKILEAPVVASGGVNEIKVEFHFCEKWDGFAKTAVFYQDETEPYYALVGEDDSCIVPWEVCLSEGTFYFSVFGEKDGIRRTSATLKYKVRKGAITESLSPSDPTPEIYDQIMAEVARVRAGQNEFIDKANQAVDAVIAEKDAFVAEANGVLDDAKKLNAESVWYVAQELTEEQKAQARQNIGAVNSYTDLLNKPFADATETENGKVLKVVDGKPVWGEPEKGVLIVKAGLTGPSHSSTEIYEAAQAGYYVVLDYFGYLLNYTGYTEEEDWGAPEVYFEGVGCRSNDPNSIRYIRVAIFEKSFMDSSEERRHFTVPNPVNNDGKILQVVEGKAIWAEMNLDSVNEDLESIKADIAELKYVPIEFGSFTVSPSVAEYGSTVKTVYLDWSLNKPVVSQNITSTSMEGTEVLAAADRSKTYDGLSLTKRETYTLVVEDEKKSISKTAAVNFYKPVYCGAMDADIEIDRAAVLSLDRRLSSSKNITFTATTGENQKLTFVQPSSYSDPVFTIDNFSYSWNPVKVLEDFANESGYVESYTVWQEPDSIPGISTVKVT